MLALPEPTAQAEGLSLSDALDLAVESLEFRAETFSVAAKLVAARGEVAVPWAVKDAGRHAKLQAAIETLKKHRAAIKPY